jgi:hypothetical protein
MFPRAAVNRGFTVLVEWNLFFNNHSKTELKFNHFYLADKNEVDTKGDLLTYSEAENLGDVQSLAFYAPSCAAMKISIDDVNLRTVLFKVTKNS